MGKDNIKIKGYKGTWYIVSDSVFRGKKVYLLEHEVYGDETACLIVDEDLNVVLDEVWNGFGDLECM